MEIIQSKLFSEQKGIRIGFSTKIAEGAAPPYYFNLSLSVGDDAEQVKRNRELFATAMGLSWNEVALQKQIHSDIVKIIEAPGFTGEGDALLTGKSRIGLAVSSGDCCAIFLYDKKHNIIGGIHSGWRGTEKRILEKALLTCRQTWGTEGQDILAYIAPAISQKNYEVGEDVAAKFPAKQVKTINGKPHLDISGVNHDMLLSFGIPESQIEVSPLCSFEEKELLHSYRRDGAQSGRAYGIIYLTGENA